MTIFARARLMAPNSSSNYQLRLADGPDSPQRTCKLVQVQESQRRRQGEQPGRSRVSAREVGAYFDRRCPRACLTYLNALGNRHAGHLQGLRQNRDLKNHSADRKPAPRLSIPRPKKAADRKSCSLRKALGLNGLPKDKFWYRCLHVSCNRRSQLSLY